MSGMNIPDFLPIPDAGVKKAPDLRSRIRICNTAFKITNFLYLAGLSSIFFIQVVRFSCSRSWLQLSSRSRLSNRRRHPPSHKGASSNHRRKLSSWRYPKPCNLLESVRDPDPEPDPDPQDPYVFRHPDLDSLVRGPDPNQIQSFGSFPFLIKVLSGLKHCLQNKVFNTVADPECLSRIPDPGSWFLPIPDPGSRIPDPKTVTKERGEIFFCSYKFHKIEYYVIFEMLKKKCGPIFKELLKFLPKKFSICSQIYGFGI
jgi:hypothetical protein